MKKLHTFCVAMALTLFSLQVSAQFETSTVGLPRYFYIESNAMEQALTGTANKVVSQTRISSFKEAASQLWIAEATATSSYYNLLNKATGLYLDITYDAGVGNRVAVLSANPSTLWRIAKAGTAYYLRANSLPSSGTGSYLSMTANATDITFATSSTGNALYNFKPAGYEPVWSDAMSDYWFKIGTAAASLTGKALTDVSETASGAPKFALQNGVVGNSAQLWKLVPNATTPTRVDFVNKATGNVIGTTTQFNGFFYPQNESLGAQSTGYTIDTIATGQYQIFSGTKTEPSYWYAVTTGEASVMYDAASVAGSAFAWIFSFDDEFISGVRVPSGSAEAQVYVKDGIIYVKGTDSYTVRTVSGIAVSTKQKLPAGIYLITIGEKTVKVLVK